MTDNTSKCLLHPALLSSTETCRSNYEYYNLLTPYLLSKLAGLGYVDRQTDRECLRRKGKEEERGLVSER